MKQNEHRNQENLMWRYKIPTQKSWIQLNDRTTQPDTIVFAMKIANHKEIGIFEVKATGGVGHLGKKFCRVYLSVKCK